MNTRSSFVLAGLTLAVAGLAWAGGVKHQEPFTETATLMEMSAVPCGSQERGFTGIGGVLATAGVEHVNAKDKLCQEYVLRTNFMQYRIRPLDEKHPVLLPVGEKAHFHIKGDHLLLVVPDGDDKQREYRVVGMKPLTSEDEGSPRSSSRPAAEVLTPVNFSPTASPGGAPTPHLERRAPALPDPPSHPEAAPYSVASLPIIAPPAAAASTTADDGDGSAPDPGDNTGSDHALNSVQVMGLVAGGVSSRRVARLVTDRGVNFQPDDTYFADLRSAGATDDLINALRAAKHDASASQSLDSDKDDLQMQESMTRGAQLARAQQFAQAEREYRKAEQLRPQDTTVHFALGYALSQEAKWGQAVSEYRLVVASDPNDAGGHANLGLALAKSGDMSGAIAEYRRALAIDPNLPALHNNLGVALKQSGDVGTARAEFRQALAENPNDPQLHTNLGSVLQQQGDLDGAVREYQQAISLQAACCQAQYNLATALEAKGDIDGALADFQKVVKTRPGDARAHAGLASALERKGDSASALLQYQTALSLAPQDSEIRAGHDTLVKRIQSGVDSPNAGSGH